MLRRDSAGLGAAIDAVDLAALAGQLRDGAYDRNGAALSAAFSAAFDELFEVVTADDFPAGHAGYGWAVIGSNPFQVVLNDGAYNRTTRAEVWWRAD
ncbi:hypothetical protein AB0I55_03270 [Actinocatenispora sera]|uniref:hypothetical protein n=1 Tax=Actinocatenispora sera TaxID=390989 RepID=UPI00340EAD2C